MTGCVLLETARIPLHLRNPPRSPTPTIGVRTQSLEAHTTVMVLCSQRSFVHYPQTKRMDWLKSMRAENSSLVSVG